MASSTRSWRQMVLDADPDFQRESLRPVVYEFSSGRKFRQRANPYGDLAAAPVAPGVLLAEDGRVLLSEDGKPLKAEGAP